MPHRTLLQRPSRSNQSRTRIFDHPNSNWRDIGAALTLRPNPHGDATPQKVSHFQAVVWVNFCDVRRLRGRETMVNAGLARASDGAFRAFRGNLFE